MNHNEPDIEDRGANISLTIENIISASHDALFERFDNLKKRGINDDDVVTALRYLEHEDLLEAYADWADIDIREDDNTTLNPVVPDPADAPSYEALADQLEAVRDAASPALSTPALDAFIRQHAPKPYDRDALLHEIDALEVEHRVKYVTDPVFHAKAKMAGNFLDQLESVHQLGDHERAGFLLAALLEQGVQA